MAAAMALLNVEAGMRTEIRQAAAAMCPGMADVHQEPRASRPTKSRG